MTSSPFRRLCARLTLAAFAATLPGPAAWAQAVERVAPLMPTAFSATPIIAPSALIPISRLAVMPSAPITTPLAAPALAASLAAPMAAVPAEAEPAAIAAAAPAITAVGTLHAAAGDEKTNPAGTNALVLFDGGQLHGGSGDDGTNGLPVQAPVIAINKVYFPATPRVTLSIKTAGVAAQVQSAIRDHDGYMIAATVGKETAKGHNSQAALVRMTIPDPLNSTSVEMTVIRPAMIIGYGKTAKGVDVANVFYPNTVASNSDGLSALATLAKYHLQYSVARFAPKISPILVEQLIKENDAERLTDMLAQNLPFAPAVKLRLLGAASIEARLQDIVTEISLQFRPKTSAEAASADPKASPLTSVETLKAKMTAIGMPDPIQAVTLREYDKYTAMTKDSEAQKARTYIEWMLDMPWGSRSEDSIDIAKSRALLDQNHTGLEMVKARILEYLALRKKTGSKKGAIIAFTGPPGVGKTTIATMIAEAMGRKFVRLSLGGVHDESVIRGHGRTYTGSMPGEIMRMMKKAGTKNPVMLLDEVDKIGRNGSAGDPTAALLEALDPEQNGTFRDRYLDEPFDLSEVLFVVTANELSNIPEALRNRMEIIDFDGYTTLEKIEIAKKNIIPRKLAATGLKPEEITLTPDAIREIAEGYTREAGVRNLEQEIETVLRKIATWPQMHDGEPAARVFDKQDVAKYLGVSRFSPRTTAQNGIGVATGLAVNGYGGATLNVEASFEAGTGQLKLRKQFGDDIEDSAKNALKYVKTHAAKLGLKDFDFKKHDIDINLTPAGKVDGPSAGGLMVTAIVSALTKRPVTPDLAMTGEITMRGDILPIGGLKQKVIAAYRMGYKEVIFPFANLKDLEDIPQEVRDGIILTPAKTYDDIYPAAIAAPAQAAPRGAVARIVAFVRSLFKPWPSRP